MGRTVVCTEIARRFRNLGFDNQEIPHVKTFTISHGYRSGDQPVTREADHNEFGIEKSGSFLDESVLETTDGRVES